MIIIKQFILWTAVSIFGGLGSYIPVFLSNASPFGGWSILLGILGSIIGVFVGVKINNNLDS